MVIALVHTPSNPITAVVIALLLFGVSRPIIHRVARAEGSPWLVRILTISLILHLLAAPAQIFVVDHFYKGVADWLRYDNQGSILAPSFRHLDFTLAHANVRGIVNDGSVSIAAGIVMAIVGVNQLGAFLVFAWLSFLGTVMFYRAFTLTFPAAQAGHRRYALMLFFLPSLIFWTADVSKEAIMALSLGVTAYGASKVLIRRKGGFAMLVLGIAIGILVRPNELLVVLGGFAVALMIRPAGVGVNRSGLKRVGSLVFMALLLGLSIFFTLHYLHSSAGSLSLTQVAKNQSGTGAGFGSSGVPYSASPLTYWRDVYTILLDPLPITAHGTGQLISSLENTMILGLILFSLRQLRIVPRAAFARPYVMMCVVYSLGFIYAFAALGNLGLITRERTLLFPFLLVLLCIPRTPKGRAPAYQWELKRKARKNFRAPGAHPAARGVNVRGRPPASQASVAAERSPYEVPEDPPLAPTTPVGGLNDPPPD
jgi:hypothetical protein